MKTKKHTVRYSAPEVTLEVVRNPANVGGGFLKLVAYCHEQGIKQEIAFGPWEVEAVVAQLRRGKRELAP